MAIYHCSIKIGGRSSGKSAVASAAYRSGQSLKDEEQGMTFDYTHKGGVVHQEILLCENAPTEYQERDVLWNAVQKIEKSKDAQLYREIELALPKEWDRQEQIQYTREYVQEQFVNNGMCADICFHDKNDGNPHAHIMLTTRPIKESGEWGVKERKAYKFDEDGKKIPKLDPKKIKQWEKDQGRKFDYKSESDEELKKVQKIGARNRREWERETVEVNDWNSHDKAEIWRKAWADKCNENLGQKQQVDHRSYERQGKDQIPTIHEGYYARQIEKKGGISERVQFNRKVKKANLEISNLKAELKVAVIKKARGIYGRIIGIIYGQIREDRNEAADNREFTIEAEPSGEGKLEAPSGEQTIKREIRRPEDESAERVGTEDVLDAYEKASDIGEHERKIESKQYSISSRIKRFGKGTDYDFGRINEIRNRLQSIRDTVSEIENRVEQIKEKEEVQRVSKMPQNPPEASEGIKVPLTDDKTITGQNKDDTKGREKLSLKKKLEEKKTEVKEASENREPTRSPVRRRGR